jgi:HAMP domain-containing protein
VALLLLTAAAYGYVRLPDLGNIRAGALRFGQGRFEPPIPVRRQDELGDLAEQVNTMARDIRGMLDAKRGLLLAVSHELRSPLTRARLNAELVAPGEARDALLRDLGTMRDLITDLLESERLSAGHAALQRERCDRQSGLVDEQLDRSDHLPSWPRLPPAEPTRCALAACAIWSTTRCVTHCTGQSALHPDRSGRWPVADQRASFGPGVDETVGPPERSLHRPTRRGNAAPAASAWVCTCAAWWPRPMAAIFTSATRIPAWN